MTKRNYCLYYIGLILCISLGTALTILMIFAVDYHSGVLSFFSGIVSVLSFVLAGFFSFCFVKTLILMKVKNLIIHIFLWNAAVVVLSMASLSIWFGGFSWDYLYLTALLYIIPCVTSSIVSALITYPKVINVQEQTDSVKNTKQDVISQMSLFFIPIVFLILYDVITMALEGFFLELFNGIQSPFTLTVVFASCAYALGVSKRTTKKFPLSELVVNAIFSVISTIVIYVYAILPYNKGDNLLKLEGGALLVIIMILLPPLAFAITSLITLAVRREKKVEDSSAA